MSHDALFQLGMGSVELDAPRTEELFTRLTLVQSDVFCLAHWEMRRSSSYLEPSFGFT